MLSKVKDSRVMGVCGLETGMGERGGLVDVSVWKKGGSEEDVEIDELVSTKCSVSWYLGGAEGRGVDGGEILLFSSEVSSMSVSEYGSPVNELRVSIVWFELSEV